ncbi:6-phosphogluconolactonase [Thiomicrorhabdus sp. zzn3]|uniref:6-phosphogluconolactonase n=1 Tax=Thiomicrorhabdus sp. zzn3 TaxID=3039775 RepID=UPI002436349B|nr:6-phosphogluconolactonase [Thiomicrorhabdus sp. zzn3]MDG6778044.1 6-phosphogluconolactonase [Thiomicrorhabdus sp. zzn3]
MNSAPKILKNGWLCFDNPSELASYAVQTIVDTAKLAIQSRHAFHFVTAGGTTPLHIYKKLAEIEANAACTDMAWEAWHVYMGDERCLPADDPELNRTALEEAWLNHSAIPLQNRHLMKGELGAIQAAQDYENCVKDTWFDITLLGMGEDGHTASLFPGHSHAHEADRLVQTEFSSPKPPAERITLSAKCLGHSRQVIKIVTGSGKKEAVKAWLNGTDLPIAQIHGENTQVWISRESWPSENDL